MKSYFKINSICYYDIDYSFERESRPGLPLYQVKATLKTDGPYHRHLLEKLKEDIFVNQKQVTLSHHEFDYDGALEKIMQYENPCVYNLEETIYGVFDIVFGTSKVNYLSISDGLADIDLID